MSGRGASQAGTMTVAIDKLHEPMRIGALTIPHRVMLAPLAGVTDLPFRRICVEMGAGLSYIEMISASALNYSSRKTGKLLVRHQSEKQLGVQVTGPDPLSVAEAVAKLESVPVDTVDINMGCPVKKIVAKNCGSAILRDPERVEETVRQVCAVTERPVTAKVRLGFDRDRRNVEDIVRRLAGAGVAMVTIHGRSREDRYDVPVDYEGIAVGVAAVHAEVGAAIPVVGNGDVLDAASAQRMLERTGCDAVMVSRGALGNPWIFKHILEPGTEPPTLAEWREGLNRHLDYHYEHYAAHRNTSEMFRRQLQWYVSGFPLARELRARLNMVSSREEIDRALDEVFCGIDQQVRRRNTQAEAVW